MIKCDVLIIGSGIAGLQLAANLSNEMNVIVLTKSNIKNGNSTMAQGGIAVAASKKDHPLKHFEDTLKAGDYHCTRDRVMELALGAPDVFNDLVKSGFKFDRDLQGNVHFGMEGAHSENRIVHSGGDSTGKNLMEFLLKSIPPNVTILEHTFAYELLLNEEKVCIGVKASTPLKKVEYFLAGSVVIASGGCGQLYEYTSNSVQATGDGLALAYLAGAEMTDMEFIQFHPTLLYKNGKVRGLVSEAVRGEGARLLTETGEYIMEHVHAQKDLAPRHVVSQRMFDYLSKGTSVFLDITSVEHFETKFPTITMMCRQAGISLEKGRLPVVPGSHFLMGGIKVDEWGRTSISNLFSIGEAACTGIHGANRLASNSLLEGLYYGKKLSLWLNDIFHSQNKNFEIKIINKIQSKRKLDLPSMTMLKKTMMERVGITRTKDDLTLQKEWLESSAFQDYLDVSLDDLSTSDKTTFFAVVTAWMITASALERNESRGGHFRSDFPDQDDRLWRERRLFIKHERNEGDIHEQIKASNAVRAIFS